MNLNIEEYDIKNNVRCKCGRDFDIHDITKLETLNQHGFYGGVVKNYSHAECPVCHRKAVLLLKQKGQTWEIINIAVPKAVPEEEIKIYKPKEQETLKEEKTSNELECKVCGKVCKSKTGLIAHMRTHNK